MASSVASPVTASLAGAADSPLTPSAALILPDARARDGESPEDHVERLASELVRERQRRHALEKQVDHYKKEAQRSFAASEAAEESISNKLKRGLEEVRQAKARLALDKERSSPGTRSLAQTMAQLQRSAVAAESDLERDRVAIVDKLQERMAHVLTDKRHLEARLAEEHAARLAISERLATATAARADMTSRVEREEHHVAHILQAKLETLRKDKAALEAKLQKEQDYLVNNLRKQLETLSAEKRALEKRVMDEGAGLITHLGTSLRRLQVDTGDDHTSLISVMLREVSQLKAQHTTLAAEREAFKKRNESLEEDIRVLQTENFVLGQRVSQEAEMSIERRKEASKYVADMEADSERTFNALSREDDRRSRARGSSFDAMSSSNRSLSPGLARSVDLMASPAVGASGASGVSRADLAEVELATRARRTSSVGSMSNVPLPRMSAGSVGSAAGASTGAPGAVAATAAAAVAATVGAGADEGNGFTASVVAAARPSTPPPAPRRPGEAERPSPQVLSLASASVQPGAGVESIGIGGGGLSHAGVLWSEASDTDEGQYDAGVQIRTATTRTRPATSISSLSSSSVASAPTSSSRDLDGSGASATGI